MDENTPIPTNRALVPVTEAVPAVVETAVEDKPKPGRKRAPATEAKPNDSTRLARSYVERLARLLREKADLSSSIADLKAAAKNQGFNPKALAVLAARELETADEEAKRVALEEEVDRLAVALGQLADTPLGQAARP